MPYRMKSGSWRPARLRWLDHAILMIGLISIAYLRAIDYLIGDDQWAARDFMIAVAPEWVWGGVGFLTGALILTYGVTTARHLFVYIGHGWLATAYGLNSLALILASGPNLAILSVVAWVGITVATAMLAHRLVGAGKSTLAFFFVAAVVALFAGAVYLSGSYDNVRGGGAVGFVSLLHVLHMLRTGGRPLRIEDATVAERVVDGGSEA